MTIEEAFIIVNKLDIAEGLRRKFTPGHFLVVFNRTGEIVKIDRFKTPPSESQILATLNSKPGCIAISGQPEMDASPQALQKRIAESMYLFDHMKH